ncbi:MAG: 4-alpha-glucanotransferase [Brevinematia bacterium]
MFERSSGILLHITSLPGKYGIGSLGAEAYEFVKFLVKSGQRLWQILPLGPTGYGDSPYQCFSAFAGNPLLIDVDRLIMRKFISKDDIPKESFDESYVDYGKVINFKYGIFTKAYEKFKKDNSYWKDSFKLFCKNNSWWLDDFSLFMALKTHFGGKSWLEWDSDIKFRKPQALEYYTNLLKDTIEFHKFLQFVFFDDWFELKSFANRNGVEIIGDIPIFVAMDSADTWSNVYIFMFDETLNPVKVAGVPPDYFSPTGQLWGNPLYDWNKLRETNYSWWIKRIEISLKMYDYVRIDHFRGFAGYWAIPYGSETAVNGAWEKAYGNDLFSTLQSKLGKGLPIIAEDLGVITPDVVELRDKFGFPGMKVLQFAFNNWQDNEYLPHNYDRNCVVYTGTHDNDTTIGWFNSLKNEDKKYVLKYANIKDERNVNWGLIRLAISSSAVFSILPMQDILGLGSEARMNRPGVAYGNWSWRVKKQQVTKNISEKLYDLSKLYSRV